MYLMIAACQDGFCNSRQTFLTCCQWGYAQRREETGSLWNAQSWIQKQQNKTRFKCFIYYIISIKIIQFKL